MIKDRELVTPIQLACIILSSLMGIALLALPRFVVLGAGTGAPLASLVGVIIGFFGLLAFVLLGTRFPQHTIMGYNEIILGPVLGNLFSASMILYSALIMGLQARQFAEVVSSALLPNTPIYFAILFMIFLCATTGFQSVATFAYIHFFYIPLIIFPIVLILLPSIQDIEVYHLMPIFGNTPSFRDFMGGGIVVTQAMLNIFVISMVIPSMKNPKLCVKGGILGYLIGGLIIIFINMMTLAVFGEVEILQMFWPTLILGRMVHIPAQILARVDSVLLISWIYGVFTTLLTYFFFIVRGASELFRTEQYRVIAAVAFPIVFFIAIFPEDIYKVYDYILKVTVFGLFLVIVYPNLLLLVAFARKKEGASV